LLFQSARPRGARHLNHWGLLSIHGFNPRAHAGRDSSARLSLPDSCAFQSARPRGARPADRIALEVSVLFQSARPRGARPPGAVADRRRWRFNPRAHAGRDNWGRAYGARPWDVSIRAPTRGATRRVRFQRLLIARFNPRAHAGRDFCGIDCCATAYWFQSARPRGARLVLGIGIAARMVVSIRAPTRGATQTHGLICANGVVSIRAPTRGATCTDLQKPLVNLEVSIRAPTRGATRLRGNRRDAINRFQSARPRGARPFPLASSAR